MLNNIILAVLWILWCFLHSFLISRSVTRTLQEKCGNRYRYYRLSYNLVSGITLLPVLYFMYRTGGKSLIIWQGYGAIVRYLLIATGLLLLWLGAKRFHMGHFMGLSQIRSTNTHSVLSGTDEITTDGILGVIRHPWYTGSIFLLWGQNMDTARLITVVILTAYLIIGAFIEERKLVAEYGKSYIDYKQRVSMFIPVRWLWGYIKKGGKAP